MGAAYRYPKYDLAYSIEAARVIQEVGGGAVTAEQLAHFLGYAGVRNGAFLNRVAAAKLFGLVEGRSSELTVSQRALRILQPEFPDMEQQARLEAFEAVPLYEAFLREYGGKQLPKPAGMVNALKRLGVSTNPRRVLTHLFDSAEQAGFFRVAGDRSRMIRPSDSRQSREEAQPSRSTASRGDTQPQSKLIEGLLEELPGDRRWDEELMRDWLLLFERALRLHYRLPRGAGSAPKD